MSEWSAELLIIIWFQTFVDFLFLCLIYFFTEAHNSVNVTFGL